jgi:hypothetical protein
MGGCDNPQLVREILDCCCWLSTLPAYPLKGSMKVIREIIGDYAKGEGVPLASHHDTVAYLPHSLSSYDSSYVTSAGRSDIPASLPDFDQPTEKKFIKALITDLNQNLISGRDTEPNLSRSAVRPVMYTAMRTGAVEKALFVGGSNAENLSISASALGLDSYKITKGGWKLTKENVDKAIPVLRETLAGLPADTPVILFCLDNSSFMGLGEDGSMNAISRCSDGDKKFHVKGALVVAPDKALSHALEQLKRLKDACGSNPVFILSPWPRFVRISCCSIAGHVSNFSDQDFLQTILRDLTKLRYHLRKTFHPTTVIDSMELICGNSYSLEKAEQVINGGWALDPVHPTKHIYAKTALNLMEKVANSRDRSAAAIPTRKRTWSASNRSEHDDGGGAGRGGHFGGVASGSGKQHKMTDRSRKWPEVRRNDGPRSYSDGGYGGYGGGCGYSGGRGRGGGGGGSGYSGGHGGSSRGAGGSGSGWQDNRYVYNNRSDGSGSSRSGFDSGYDRFNRGEGGGGGGSRGGRGWKAGRSSNPY